MAAAVVEKRCEYMSVKSVVKNDIVRKIMAALVIVGLLVSVNGIGKLTVYADTLYYNFPNELGSNKTISIDNTQDYPTEYSGLLVVFCKDEATAQEALEFGAHSFSDYSDFGTVEHGYSVEVPDSVSGVDDTVMNWRLMGSDTVVLTGTSSYDFAAYYVDATVPTYNIYCAYGDDASQILDGYFSSHDDNFLSGFDGRITARDTEPSQIAGYDVVSWKKIGEDTAEVTADHPTPSSNIAVYQAVYEGGFSCIPGEGVDADAYEKTKEFSLANSSDAVTIPLPSAEDAGFSRTGYKLLGWTEEEGIDDYILPGADHELYPGEIRDYFAAWEAKTEVTLKVTVDAPVYDDEDIASKISVQRTPEEAPGTPALEYKVKGADDSTYSDNVPTSAGEYTVRATLEESEDYALAEGTADFEVLSSTLDVSIQYKPGDGTGGTIKKSVTAELSDDYSKAQVTLLDKADFKRTGYKLAGWTDGKKTYDLGGVYAFSVDEDDTTASLTFTAVWERVPEVEVNVQYSPNGGTGDKVNKTEIVKLSDDYKTGKITLLDKADFKREGYTLVGWSDGKKTYDLGSVYTFSVASDETSKSLAFDAVWSGKEKGSVEIKLDTPVYVGAKIEYNIKKNSKGKTTVEYKKQSEGDSKYTEDVPKEPGYYVVRVTLDETDDYTADEDTKKFEIEYLTPPQYPYSYEEDRDDAGNLINVFVKPADDFEIGLSQTSFESRVPYAAAKEGGVYLQRKSDFAITDKITVDPYYIEDKPELIVEGAEDGKVLYGTPYKVLYTSASPAAKRVLYKDKNAKVESAYSETAPTKPGNYTVKLSADAAGFYAPVSITEDFSIVYLDADPGEVSLEGDGEKNGWFRSNVKIIAPTGYLISTTDEIGTFKESITWNKNIKQLYYQRIEDSAITNAITFDRDIKIDTVKPTAVFPDGLKVDDTTKTITIFMDELTFKIKEDNLKELKVGNDKIDVNSGKNGVYEISLEAGEEAENIKISAEDLAGNKYEFTLTLVPSWGADGIMPADRFVKLNSGTVYKLKKESDWTVEVNDKEDKTVYTGGSEFYVKNDGTRCKFSEKK